MTTATRDVHELEAEIRRAHASGDKATLERLQEEYRSGGYPVVRTYYGPGAVTIRDGQRSSAPARMSSTPARSTPKVSGGAGVRVVISTDADQAIRESDLDDGREQSGGLYGYEANGEIVIERATVTRNQLRLRDATEIDAGQIEEMERHFRGAGWQLLGHWHSHPEAGIPPSTDDRRNWQEWANSRRTGWVGVIADPTHNWLHGKDCSQRSPETALLRVSPAPLGYLWSRPRGGPRGDPLRLPVAGAGEGAQATCKACHELGESPT